MTFKYKLKNCLFLFPEIPELLRTLPWSHCAVSLRRTSPNWRDECALSNSRAYTRRLWLDLPDCALAVRRSRDRGRDAARPCQFVTGLHCRRKTRSIRRPSCFFCSFEKPFEIKNNSPQWIQLGLVLLLLAFDDKVSDKCIVILALHSQRFGPC